MSPSTLTLHRFSQPQTRAHECGALQTLREFSWCVLLTLVALLTAPSLTAAKPKDTLPDSFYDIDPAEAAQNQHYNQPYRPQFHYTPMQGFVGDATGLIYDEGKYHLFYMSDKWERRKNRHKCWGYATSPDCLHWQEQPSILDPVLDHKPGSGSGIVDWNNTLGLAMGAQKTLAVFYTDYKTGSCIAYSTNSGRDWVRHPRNPVLRGAGTDRDPVVFWYPPAAEWRLVRFDGKTGFAFYGSTNLLDWKYLSQVEGFNECPDFFELPVEGSAGQRKWVLMDAGFNYLIGTFDGRQFTAETDMLRGECAGSKSVYACQTWKRSPDNSTPPVQMAFLRYPPECQLTWLNQMTFPCEVRLRKLPEGLRVCRQPIPGIESLRAEPKSWRDLTLKPGQDPLVGLHGDAFDIRAEVELSEASSLVLSVRGETIRYPAANRRKEKRLEALGSSVPLSVSGNRLKLEVLVDRSSVEVFADQGQVTLSKACLFNPAKTNLSVTAEGGELRVNTLTVSRMKSIWSDPRMPGKSKGPAQAQTAKQTGEGG